MIERGVTLGVWGIAVSVIGAMFTASGLCLQKIVHRRLALNPALGPAHSHRLYIVGVFYVAIGVLCNIANDGMLPLIMTFSSPLQQSTQAPLAAQTVVYSSLLEYFFLGGELSLLQVVAMFVMVLGMIFSMLGANLFDPGYTLNTILRNLTETPSLAYTLVGLMAIFTAKRFVKRTAEGYTGVLGLLYLASCAGMVTGWLGTIVKSIVEISIGTVEVHSGDLKRIAFWVIILFLPFLASLKLRLVSRGLSNFHNLLFMPIYQSFVIIANAICGGVYFLEFSQDDAPTSLSVYILGTAITIVGVLLTVHKYDPSRHLETAVFEEVAPLVGSGAGAGTSGGTSGIPGIVGGGAGRIGGAAAGGPTTPNGLPMAAADMDDSRPNNSDRIAVGSRSQFPSMESTALEMLRSTRGGGGGDGAGASPAGGDGTWANAHLAGSSFTSPASGQPSWMPQYEPIAADNSTVPEWAQIPTDSELGGAGNAGGQQPGSNRNPPGAGGSAGGWA